MLAEYASQLDNMKIVLASSSPRRQSILKDNLGLSFQVVVPDFAEDINKNHCFDEEDYVSQTSRGEIRKIRILHKLQV